MKQSPVSLHSLTNPVFYVKRFILARLQGHALSNSQYCIGGRTWVL